MEERLKPFKAEVQYRVVRMFKYTSDKRLARNDIVPFSGQPNDDKIAAGSLVRQEIKYFCRRPRCNKKFDSIVTLIEHERSHDK